MVHAISDKALPRAAQCMRVERHRSWDERRENRGERGARSTRLLRGWLDRAEALRTARPQGDSGGPNQTLAAMMM